MTAEIEKSLCIVSVDTLQELFSIWGGDPVALYMFYYKQSKIQKTNQSKSTDSFCIKWLWWWTTRLRRSKKILQEANLIESIATREKDWSYWWHYIKLNYIRSEAKTSQSYQKQLVDITTSGKQKTNAWSDININAWSDININNILYTIQDYVASWNSITELKQNWKKVRWLPKTIKITQKIKYARNKVIKEYTEEEIKNATNKYIEKIEKTIPNQNWDWTHRYTLFEFITRDKWLQNYVNS